MTLIGTTLELVKKSLAFSSLVFVFIESLWTLLISCMVQLLWPERFTWEEVLVLVLSEEFMEVAKEMEVDHHISVRAVVVLLAIFSNSWRQWALSSLTLKEGEESLRAVNGIWIRLLGVLQLNHEELLFSLCLLWRSLKNVIDLFSFCDFRSLLSSALFILTN